MENLETKIEAINNSIAEYGYHKTLALLCSVDDMPLVFVAYVVAHYNRFYRSNERLTVLNVLKFHRGF